MLEDDLRKQVIEWQQRENAPKRSEIAKGENRAEVEIREADALLAMMKTGDREKALPAGLTALGIFRSHGEHLSVIKALENLCPLMLGQAFKKLDHFVRESIALEEHYQNRAITAYEQFLGKEKDEATKAVHYYLLGELHRRTRQWDRALDCHDKALATQALNPMLHRWAGEQKELTVKQSKAGENQSH